MTNGHNTERLAALARLARLATRRPQARLRAARDRAADLSERLRALDDALARARAAPADDTAASLALSRFEDWALARRAEINVARAEVEATRRTAEGLARRAEGRCQALDRLSSNS